MSSHEVITKEKLEGASRAELIQFAVKLGVVAKGKTPALLEKCLAALGDDDDDAEAAESVSSSVMATTLASALDAIKDQGAALKSLLEKQSQSSVEKWDKVQIEVPKWDGSADGYEASGSTWRAR